MLKNTMILSARSRILCENVSERIMHDKCKHSEALARFARAYHKYFFYNMIVFRSEFWLCLIP